MAVHIDYILFNVDPMIGEGALNIRVNAFHSVTLPEWRPGLKDPKDAPAAYTIGRASPGPRVIQALFRRDASEETVWIKAVDRSKDGRNILGCIPEFRVDFLGSDERVITIPTKAPLTASVGLHDDIWEWRYRTYQGDLGSAGTSQHRIYKLLGPPNPPWNSSSPNSYLWPWREMLDVSCEWAEGAETTDQAAQAIGDKIMALGASSNGRPLLRYDIRDTNSFFANDPFFDCREFLRTVNLEPYAIHKCDCSDFASMISTSANAVGCNLATVVLRMIPKDPNKFRTNPVKPVGLPTFDPLFPPFRYHEFGFAGEPGPNGFVWDCCFFVDGDADPVNPPHCPIPGLNLRFGAPGDFGYLDRLVRPSFRSLVSLRIEQPNRSITPMVERAGARNATPLLNFSIPPVQLPPSDKIFIARFFLAGIHFKGLTLRRMLFPCLVDGNSAIDSFWELDDNPNVLVRLQIEIETTTPNAQDVAVSRAMRPSVPLSGVLLGGAKPLTFPVKGVGNVVIIENIGNLALGIHNVGFDDQDLNDLHNQIRELFRSWPKPKCDMGVERLYPSLKTDVKIELKHDDGSVWFKLFTSTGDLFSQQDDVYYSPGGHKSHAIDVFEMSGMEAVTHYRYEFDLP